MVFGEALAFYEDTTNDELLVVYHPFTDIEVHWGVVTWGKESSTLEVRKVESIINLVGISYGKNGRVYIHRKHSAMTAYDGAL